MEEFKVGDIVEFKSGGPAMTIIKVLPKKDVNLLAGFKYECEYWNDKLSTFSKKSFYEGSLKKASASLF